jgi:A/G-specific adenine glycosylase
MDNVKKFFVQNILKYYSKNKRDLPWRNTKDPYKIWISEIILQQTQVKQGLNYYQKFIQRFPNIESLANAKEDEVLHLWQGLGYYSRARNLHFAAQQIQNQFGGVFPQTYNEILSLKGIGEYAAAAIASFAFDLPYAVVDGNVFRVLSRFFGIRKAIDSSEGKKFFFDLGNELLDKTNPSEYNQAIMEFGATFCTPQSPDCPNCCLNKYCIAYKENSVQQLPVKSKSINKTTRYLNYFVFIEKDKYIYLNKRTNTDIWKGLYEFYLVESKHQNFSLNKIKEHLNQLNISPQKIISVPKIKHLLSHQNLFIKITTIYVNEKISSLNLQRIELKQIENYALPVVLQKFVKVHLNSLLSKIIVNKKLKH